MEQLTEAGHVMLFQIRAEGLASRGYEMTADACRFHILKNGHEIISVETLDAVTVFLTAIIQEQETLKSGE